MSELGDWLLLEQLREDLGEVAELGLGLELLHYAQRLKNTKDLTWVDLMVWRVTPAAGHEALRYSLLALALMAPVGGVWLWKAASAMGSPAFEAPKRATLPV